MNVCEPLVTEIVGFDKDGLYVGEARLGLAGWYTQMSGQPFRCPAPDRNTAETRLINFGAITLREGDGRK